MNSQTSVSSMALITFVSGLVTRNRQPPFTPQEWALNIKLTKYVNYSRLFLLGSVFKNEFTTCIKSYLVSRRVLKLAQGNFVPMSSVIMISSMYSHHHSILTTLSSLHTTQSMETVSRMLLSRLMMQLEFIKKRYQEEPSLFANQKN